MPKINERGTTTTKENKLTPYWQTTDVETVRLYQGDVLEVLGDRPEREVSEGERGATDYWCGLVTTGAGVVGLQTNRENNCW